MPGTLLTTGRASCAASSPTQLPVTLLTAIPLLAAPLMALACAPKLPPATPSAPMAQAAPSSTASTATPNPQASEAQLAAAQRLSDDTARLVELGERDADHPLILADATDWLFLKLESLGFGVRRVGFATEDAAAQNLEVLVEGSDASLPRVALTVPFDSPAGGTDWRSAMATAVQISLAERLQLRPQHATTALIWLSYTHEPAIVAERSGSFAHAKQARINDEKYSAVVNFRFVDAAANVVQVRGMPRASELVERIGAFFRRDPALRVTSEVAERVSGDAIAFDRVEYPAVELNLGYPGAASESNAVPGDARIGLGWLERLERLLAELDRSGTGSAQAGVSGTPPEPQ